MQTTKSIRGRVSLAARDSCGVVVLEISFNDGEMEGVLGAARCKAI
jgi:hypothetical protein